MNHQTSTDHGGPPAAERELWARAGGVWISHWVTRDAAGGILDEFDARIDSLVDVEGGRLYQRNRYTRADGSVEDRRFRSRWIDGVLTVPAGPMTGRIRVLDDRTLLLHFSNADGSAQSFETTVFVADDRRARCNMHVEHGRIVRTTVMYDEHRIDEAPAIGWDDAD